MGISLWAQRGKKCICISTGSCWFARETGEKLLSGPKKGDVLAIRLVRHLSDETTLNFQGIEGFFEAKSFRPLVERTMKQDLAMFRQFLVGAPNRVPVAA